MSKPTQAQRAVLTKMAKPCDIAGWQYGPQSHPFWSDSPTFRSLIRRGWIVRYNVRTLAREGWIFTAHVCELTPAGRAAAQGE